MSLASLSIMSNVAPGRLLRAVLRACLVFGVLAWEPLTARADDRCAFQCAQRQNTCAANCAQGERCRQHCNRSADTCFARCQKSEDERDVAQQKRAQKLCTTKEGRPRQCTAAEAKQLREDMDQASKLMCRDPKGEMIACPEQLKQMEELQKLFEKDCPGGTCKGNAPN